MNIQPSDLAERADLAAVSTRNGAAPTAPGNGPEPAWLRPAREALTGLLDLPENWNSYGAPAIDVDATDRALELLSQVMQPETPAPHVVPTHHGGVQLEWHRRGVDLEIEITPRAGCTAYYLNHLTGEEWERELTSSSRMVRPLVL